MPNGHPNYCHLCGETLKRMGIKYGCWRCAVIVNRRGGIVFPENENNPLLQESPPLRNPPPLDLSYNTFKVFEA